jgi:hypothetical protein
VVGRRADIVRRAHRLYRAPGCALSQYSNDLFLAESTPLHVLLLFEQNSSYVTSPLLGLRPPPSAFGLSRKMKNQNAVELLNWMMA